MFFEVLSFIMLFIVVFQYALHTVKASKVMGRSSLIFLVTSGKTTLHSLMSPHLAHPKFVWFSSWWWYHFKTYTYVSCNTHTYIINSNMRIRSFSCNLNKLIAISPLIDGQTLIKLCSTVIFIPLNSIESPYSSHKTALMEPLSYHIHLTNPH